ncbi:MAG: hypothetical protein K6B70_08325 [Clostridia bacterium]|nr:hypothetical protein [Clostridia bacterium]
MKKNVLDCMTSELLHQALIGNPDNKDIYLAEYEQRLKTAGIQNNQIEKFRKLDEKAISNGCYIKID